MATTTATTQTRPAANRGRGGGGGGNKGRRGRGGSAKHGPPRDPAQNTKSDAHSHAVAQVAEEKIQDLDTATANGDAATDGAAEDGTVCWICAEPVKYWSVSECNHRTCHVCALRLRALYKKLECTFCKVRYRTIHTYTSSFRPVLSH